MVWRGQEPGTSRSETGRKLALLLDREVPEVQALFVRAAEVGYPFDAGRLFREAAPFADNASVRQITAAAADWAGQEVRSRTQALRFRTPGGIQNGGAAAVPLRAPSSQKGPLPRQPAVSFLKGRSGCPFFSLILFHFCDRIRLKAGAGRGRKPAGKRRKTPWPILFTYP